MARTRKHEPEAKDEDVPDDDNSAPDPETNVLNLFGVIEVSLDNAEIRRMVAERIVRVCPKLTLYDVEEHLKGRHLRAAMCNHAVMTPTFFQVAERGGVEKLSEPEKETLADDLARFCLKQASLG